MASKKVNEFLKSASAFKDEQTKQKYDEFRSRRGKELQLWHAWDQNGRKEEDLKPLLKSVDPLIASETKKRMAGLGGSIPQSALKNELRIAAVKAFEKYDPSRAQLSTHLINRFQSVTDFVAAGRNQLYAPRPDVEKRQELMNAKELFMEEHGREPSVAELHAKMPHISKARITRMNKAFGGEVYSSLGEVHDDTFHPPDVRDAFLLMRPGLTDHQQQFGELHYPETGVKQKSVAAIAKTMGIPQHKAYLIKTEVEKKLERVLKRE